MPIPVNDSTQSLGDDGNGNGKHDPSRAPIPGRLTIDSGDSPGRRLAGDLGSVPCSYAMPNP